MTDVTRTPERAASAAAAPAPNRPLQSYLLCATPRTGSYLLCDLLKQTGVAGQPTEYFSSGFQGYWSAQWANPSYPDYLRRIVALGTGTNGVLGVKAHPRQFRYFARQETGLPATSREQEQAALERWLPDVRYVWMRRRDVLRQGISWARSMQTNIWWDASEAPAPFDRPTPEALRFDYNLITGAQARMRNEDRMWAEYFDANGISPLVLWYEDLASDRAGSLSKVLQYLGLTVPADIDPPAPSMRRQSDQVTERWGARFQALAAARVEATWSGVHRLEADHPDFVVVSGGFNRPDGWEEARHSIVAVAPYHGPFKPDYAVGSGVKSADLSFVEVRTIAASNEILLPGGAAPSGAEVAVQLGADRVGVLVDRDCLSATELFDIGTTRVFELTNDPAGLDLDGFLQLPSRPAYERDPASGLRIVISATSPAPAWASSLRHCLNALTRHHCVQVQPYDHEAFATADVVVLTAEPDSEPGWRDGTVVLTVVSEPSFEPEQLSLELRAADGRVSTVPWPLSWWTAGNRPVVHTGRPVVLVAGGENDQLVQSVVTAVQNLAEVVTGTVAERPDASLVLDLGSQPGLDSLLGLCTGAVVFNRFAARSGKGPIDWLGAPPFACATEQDAGWLVAALLSDPRRLAERSAESRRWIERHYDFTAQWDEFWVPAIAAARSSLEGVSA